MQSKWQRAFAVSCLFAITAANSTASEYDQSLLQQRCMSSKTDLSKEISLAYCRVLAEVTGNATVAARTLKRMAEIHIATGINFRAAELFDELIERQPRNLVARKWRAEFSLERGCGEKASVDYSYIIENEPENKEAYIGRGLARADEGKYEEAIIDVEHAMSIDPAYADAYRARGDINYIQGHNEKALDDFNKAIILAPKRADLHVTRANFLKSIEQYDKAYLAYDAAVALDPENVEARFNIGRLNYLIADTRAELFAAAAYLRLVLIQDPKRDAAAFLVANAMSRLGRTEDAMKHHRMFLKRASGFADDYKAFLADEGYYVGEIDYESGEAFWAALRACVEDKCRLLPRVEWRE